MTRTRPYAVSTSIVRRPATKRVALDSRTPRVLLRWRIAVASSSPRPASATALSRWPGRPFFITVGVMVTSRAPDSIRSSTSAASRLGGMSSRFVSTMVTVVDSATARPSQRPTALPGSGRAPRP